MNTRRRLIAAALASPVVLAACKVRTINEFPVTPADVRAVNLMLGSTGVDILDGDQVVFGALPFEAGTGYVEFDNERKTFVLRSLPPAQPLDFARNRRVRIALDVEAEGIVVSLSHIPGRHAAWALPALAV